MIQKAINASAAYGAGRIGKLRGAKEINYLAHKALHGALGAGLGAAMATVSTTARSIHQGRHVEAVSANLATEMDRYVRAGQQLGWTQPQYHSKLMEIITKERQSLKSGDRILNKHHRAWATDGGKVQPQSGVTQ